MPADRAPTPASARRRWAVAIGLALFAVAVVAALVAFVQPRADQTPQTDLVRVTRDTQTQTISVAGTIRPRDQATVTFKVPGSVRTVDVKVGDRVKAGQQLATVGTRDLTDAVTLARANLAAARAQLSAVRNADRSTAAQVEAARAQVRSAEASENSARNRLGDATLRAPVAGTIAKVTYEVGDAVAGSAGSLGSASSGSAGVPNVSDLGGLTGSTGSSSGPAGQIVLVSTGAWQLDASVGTADLPSLKAGQKAAVTPTGTSTTVAARVDTVGIVAEQASGSAATFPVTLAIDGSTDKLYSGSSADAVVTVGTVADVLTLPETAVTTQDGVSTVRLTRGTVVTTQAVQTGRQFAGRVEITSGLSEGDLVQAPRGVVVTSPPPPQYGPPRTTPSR